jgi:hypothetical protein
MTSQAGKYRVEMYEDSKDAYTLSLRIYSIDKHDFGTYTCEALNSLGQDAESMILYGKFGQYISRVPTRTVEKTLLMSDENSK